MNPQVGGPQPHAQPQVEQAWQTLAQTVVNAQAAAVSYSDEAILEMALAQKRYSDDLCETASRSAQREDVESVSKRHVKDAVRELHVRKRADWSRALGMFFLGLAIQQYLRLRDAGTISLESVNVLVVFAILTLSFIIPALFRERPWALFLNFGKRKKV